MLTTRHMIRLAFPSKTLIAYASKMFLWRFLAMLIGLVTILQMLDLLANQDKILAAEGATTSEIFYYLKLRLPQLISQFIPFSVLLASLLTLATLNQHSEIIVMKASGLSAHHILFPLGIPCLLIALLHFAFDSYIVGPSTAELRYWQQNDYAVELPPAPSFTASPRVADGRLLILADSASQSGNVVILDNISLYDRDETGLLVKWTTADFALYTDQRWMLFTVNEFDAQSHVRRTFESLPAPFSIAPQRFLRATVEPDFLSFGSLNTIIQAVDSEGGNSDRLRAALYHKITGPLASLLMPLLGAVAGFGIHRSSTLLIRAVIGMALGFAFFVADNFMMAMGEFGVAPPVLAAGAPFVLFLTVGFAVLFYTEE